jgi:Putative glycolipid-binding
VGDVGGITLDLPGVNASLDSADDQDPERPLASSSDALGSWATRLAHVTSRSVAGERALELATDGAGSWQVDSRHISHLDGCLDIDLESSALTNAFPRPPA